MHLFLDASLQRAGRRYSFHPNDNRATVVLAHEEFLRYLAAAGNGLRVSWSCTDPPMRYIETKTILSKLRTADRWFGIAYNMNLYRGCQHGCIYCDTRSDCYGIGDIAQIAVKRNALELLPAELRARRKKRATIGTGSMNDPYMPVERELRLTRRALGMIADDDFLVHVITKSSLAERDADILQEISATYAAVSFTVTCADDALSVRTEPAPRPLRSGSTRWRHWLPRASIRVSR